jgi:hypothetical protein
MKQGKRKKRKKKVGDSRQRKQKNQDTPALRPRTCYTGLVEYITHISTEKEFQIIR